MNCDRCMGIGTGVEDEGVGFGASALDGVDDGAFAIGLAELELVAEALRVGSAKRLNICQSFGAVDLRLSCSEQVEVGAVDNMKFFHLSSVAWRARPEQ